MQTFKSLSDIQQLSQDHPAYPSIKLLLQQIINSNTTANRSYNPEEDGYIVLIEIDDIDRVLDERPPTPSCPKRQPMGKKKAGTWVTPSVMNFCGEGAVLEGVRNRFGFRFQKPFSFLGIWGGSDIDRAIKFRDTLGSADS